MPRNPRTTEKNLACGCNSRVVHITKKVLEQVYNDKRTFPYQSYKAANGRDTKRKGRVHMERFAEKRMILVGHPANVEVLDACFCLSTHFVRLLRIGQELNQSRSKADLIPHGTQEAMSAILDDLRNPTDPRGDHWYSRGEGFHDGLRHTLSRAAQGEDI